MNKKELIKKLGEYKNLYRNSIFIGLVYFSSVAVIVYLKKINCNFPVTMFFFNQICSALLHFAELRFRLEKRVKILEQNPPYDYTNKIHELEIFANKINIWKEVLFKSSWFWLGIEILRIAKILY